jgi:arsenical pump membrane protein
VGEAALPAVHSTGRVLGGVLAVAGSTGLAAACLVDPADTRAAAVQDWPPFVLVAGLLLVGLVADGDGLFAAAGHQLARSTRSGIALFIGASFIIGVVTATLNLDTAVAFLTPVLVYAGRARGGGERPLLYGCLLLANAGSLLLPGSNLTNLIVLGHLHLSGGQFLARMWLPALGALVVTGAVVGVIEHRELRVARNDLEAPRRPVLGVGLVAVVATTVLVLVLRTAALPVGAVGLVAITLRLVARRQTIGHVIEVLGLPVLIGLFGVAVALGALGRSWSGPATLLTHLDLVGTAAAAAAGAVVLNNLPAASLFASRVPPHPFALLVGLNLGPNLCASGSLAWLLWIRSARAAGMRPSIATASRLGLVAVPLSMTAALGALVITGAR